MKATHSSLYPHASKAIIKDFFFLSKTLLIVSFGMKSRYYCIPIPFEVLLALSSPSKLVLLQEDSIDHSSGFDIYSLFGPGDQLNTSLSKMMVLVLESHQTLK